MNAALTSAGGCIGKLPVDVFRHILGTLDPEDDKDTLSACSLVSQTWSDLAQPILFYSAKIGGRMNHRLDDFAELLTRRPQIALWIKKLRLDSHGWNHNATRPDLTLLMDVLARTSALQELCLDTATFCNPPMHVIRPVCLRRLWIKFLTPGNSYMLSFFKPDTLEVFATYESPQNQPARHHLSAQPAIRRLVLWDASMSDEGLAFYQANLAPQCLQSFSAKPCDWTRLRHVCNFVWYQSRSLRDVDLDAVGLLVSDQLACTSTTCRMRSRHFRRSLLIFFCVVRSSPSEDECVSSGLETPQAGTQ